MENDVEDSIIDVSCFISRMKKYVFVPVYLIFAALLLVFFDSFVFYFLAGILFMYAIIYLLMKGLGYSEKYLYFGKKKIAYDQLIKIKTFEINLFVYFIFKVREGNKTRYYLIDPGKLSLLDILYSFFSSHSKVHKINKLMETLKRKSPWAI